MVRLLGKRRQLLIISVVLIAVVLVVAMIRHQSSLVAHKYPQQAVHDDSNLLLHGVVFSIEENYAHHGYGFQGWFRSASYHSFRYYLLLNITEVVWSNAGESLWNDTFSKGDIIGIGYDFDEGLLEVDVGQTVECQGYYLAVTDTPYSFIITVMPTITDSFLKTPA